jgi:flagellar protein FlgJ
MDRFRAYGSPTDSFRDYVNLLGGNPRYAGALNTGSDASAFAAALQRGGYSTDPAYAHKLAAIAQNLAGPAAQDAGAATDPGLRFKSADAQPINPTSKTL